MAVHANALLSGEIRLRDVIEEDLPIFFEHQCQPDANRMAAFPPRAKDAFLAHWTRILADESVTIKSILFSGQVAGNIVSWERDRKRLVGYWVGEDYWGKGIASKALSDFLGMDEVRPLYAHVAKQNVASIRVLEKCGFSICADEKESPGLPDDGIEELIFVLGTNRIG
jgi:RimJ/RimL family protein N-acetyltransferase